MTSQELLAFCLFGMLMTVLVVAHEIRRPRTDDHLPPSKRSFTLFSWLHLWVVVLLLFCHELISLFVDVLHKNL